jgi:cytidylate kinase
MARERLHAYLARAGVASRRAAERLIAEGRVTVNGRRAAIGQAIEPGTDAIEVDGESVAAPRECAYFALHKPAGMISSARDERGRPSVLRLLPSDGRRLWPAGRLDADSEGLMVVTDDGGWANRVLHPRHGTRREYAVLVHPAPDDALLARLRRGVVLDDGPAHLLAARRAAPPPEVGREPGQEGTWLRVELGEGRKREVRRLFGAVGCDVLRLVRTRLGPLRLDGLRAGDWRPLSTAEVEALGGARTGGAGARRRGPVVAIDGPSGAGKSTVGHALARRIGATFVDTGLFYRALTAAALDRGVDPDDGAALARLAGETRIELRPADAASGRRERVVVDGRDVSRAARARRVDRAVSAVSAHAAVRSAMLELQRAAARHGGAVLVGRDIGTVVLPDADLKIWLVADPHVRAARRASEMGDPERASAYLAEIEERDRRDASREAAPLRRPDGALVIDTGLRDVEACVERIVAALRERGLLVAEG